MRFWRNRDMYTKGVFIIQSINFGVRSSLALDERSRRSCQATGYTVEWFGFHAKYADHRRSKRRGFDEFLVYVFAFLLHVPRIMRTYARAT